MSNEDPRFRAYEFQDELILFTNSLNELVGPSVDYGTMVGNQYLCVKPNPERTWRLTPKLDARTAQQYRNFKQGTIFETGAQVEVDCSDYHLLAIVRGAGNEQPTLEVQCMTLLEPREYAYYAQTGKEAIDAWQEKVDQYRMSKQVHVDEQRMKKTRQVDQLRQQIHLLEQQVLQLETRYDNWVADCNSYVESKILEYFGEEPTYKKILAKQVDPSDVITKSKMQRDMKSIREQLLARRKAQGK